MTFWRALRALVAKDARLMARRPGVFLGLWSSVVLVLLMTSLGGSSAPEALRERGAAALWLGLFLAASVFLSDTFSVENEDGAEQMLLILGVNNAAIYYAKAIVNATLLFAAGLFSSPVMVALFGATAPPVQFSGVLALGCLALAAPGTLFSALVAETDRKASLLPILLLPLVMPVLIAATKAMGLLVYGDPMNQGNAWNAMLLLFAGLHWTIDGLLYGKAVD